jgi:hypothetical protein
MCVLWLAKGLSGNSATVDRGPVDHGPIVVIVSVEQPTQRTATDIAAK